MKRTTNIVFIGSGNVAYHIAQSFQEQANLNIVQVFNHRKTKNAIDFARKSKTHLVTDYKLIDTSADVYIIAVKDDALENVVKNLAPLQLKGLVAHTSGSLSLDVLKNTSANIGVYYPLETFYKNAAINWKTTPLLIEANTKSGLLTLKNIASGISKKVKVLNSQQRLQIHLAAVFACNFTNALYVSAFQLIEESIGNNDTKLLLPIMQHSFQKLESIHPQKAQTGPAMRGDKVVMNKHLSLLKHNKQLSQIYKQLSQLIVDQQS